MKLVLEYDSGIISANGFDIVFGLFDALFVACLVHFGTLDKPGNLDNMLFVYCWYRMLIWSECVNSLELGQALFWMVPSMASFISGVDSRKCK